MTKATRIKRNTKKKRSLFLFKVLVYVINASSINNLQVLRFIFISIKCRMELCTEFYSGKDISDTGISTNM